MQQVISVTGLGYVGLPLALNFARVGHCVIGYDNDPTRVSELSNGFDRNAEVSVDELKAAAVSFRDSPESIADARVHVITVPTPVTSSRLPDLGALNSASAMVGKHMKPGSIVVYESTVFPGATEDHCLPILEEASGLKAGTEFAVGYSPERINPGDTMHTVDCVTKIVAGQCEGTTDFLAKMYGTITNGAVHRAPSIRIAEAAKIVENVQRDMNIALMNELATIFHRLGIDTKDVIKAAGTKWNFAHYEPGLVGGHCIGVDPYYLTYCAEQVGIHPSLVLAGRRTNETMCTYIVREAIGRALRNGAPAVPKVAVLGITYKENVRDIRNSRVPSLIAELERFGATVQLADAVCDSDKVHEEYGLKVSTLDELAPCDIVILAVAHSAYSGAGWSLIRQLLRDHRGLVVDVKAALDRDAIPAGVTLWRI